MQISRPQLYLLPEVNSARMHLVEVGLNSAQKLPILVTYIAVIQNVTCLEGRSESWSWKPPIEGNRTSTKDEVV